MGSERHWLNTIRHLCVTSCDCYVLKQVLELTCEGDTTKASTNHTGSLDIINRLIISLNRVLMKDER